MVRKRESTAGSAKATEVAPPPVPRTYRRRLASLTNVRTALADVYRQLEGNELEPKKARTMVYALQVLAGIIQGTDLEERLAVLEGRGRTA